MIHRRDVLNYKHSEITKLKISIANKERNRLKRMTESAK
jgi:hypothetical protein